MSPALEEGAGLSARGGPQEAGQETAAVRSPPKRRAGSAQAPCWTRDWRVLGERGPAALLQTESVSRSAGGQVWGHACLSAHGAPKGPSVPRGGRAAEQRQAGNPAAWGPEGL